MSFVLMLDTSSATFLHQTTWNANIFSVAKLFLTIQDKMVLYNIFLKRYLTKNYYIFEYYKKKLYFFRKFNRKSTQKITKKLKDKSSAKKSIND